MDGHEHIEGTRGSIIGKATQGLLVWALQHGEQLLHHAGCSIRPEKGPVHDFKESVHAGNGFLSYGELWSAIQRAPVLGQARRDMRRIAGLARTPAEKEDALRRAHTHKRTFSFKRDEFTELVLGHANSSTF